MNTKCVKIEKLAECDNGKITKSGWTEYYARGIKFGDEYDAWLKEDENGTHMPSVGERGDWLNWWGTDFVADRMTVNIEKYSWECARAELEDAIAQCYDSGVERMLTIGGENDFATFRLTPLERIPEFVDEGKETLGYEVPERIKVILANAIRKANGDAETPLPPKPQKTFRIRFSRIDEGEANVDAECVEDAIAKAQAMGSKDGVWLQSDPDHTQGDWQFDCID